MRRRSFLKNSLITGSLASLLPVASFASESHTSKKKTSREFYELRVYTLKNETQQRLVEDYFSQAAIPAMNRFGIKNIGVFTELKPTGNTKILVLIPFKSMDIFLSINEKLSLDTTNNQAGSAYLTAPASAPAYERIESSLLHAFDHMPLMQVPEKKSRIFELRRYESASEVAGKKKIEMFNSQGEIEIFKRVGLTPVFFGETLIGNLRPNLTYMLTYDDMDARSKNWKTFVSDPQWKKISAMPDYADSKIVSHITSTFLVPTEFSQV